MNIWYPKVIPAKKPASPGRIDPSVYFDVPKLPDAPQVTASPFKELDANQSNSLGKPIEISRAEGVPAIVQSKPVVAVSEVTPGERPLSAIPALGMTLLDYPILPEDLDAKADRSNSWAKDNLATGWKRAMEDNIPACLHPQHNEIRVLWSLYSMWLNCRPKIEDAKIGAMLTDLETHWYPWMMDNHLSATFDSFLMWLQVAAPEQRAFFKVSDERVARYVLSCVGPLWCSAGFLITGINITNETVTVYKVGQTDESEVEPVAVPLRVGDGFFKDCLANQKLIYIKKK